MLILLNVSVPGVCAIPAHYMVSISECKLRKTNEIGGQSEAVASKQQPQAHQRQTNTQPPGALVGMYWHWAVHCADATLVTRATATVVTNLII